MKRKVSVLLLIGVALFLALVVFNGQTIVSAKGGAKFLPFKVNCETYPSIMGVIDGNLVLEIPSDCKGTYLGNGEWFADSLVDITNPTPPNLQTGEMVFTAANGDQLSGNFFGYAMPKESGGNYYWGGYEITGGTGRFDGVTGSGLYHGQADGEVGSAIFDGTLMWP